MIQQSVDGSKGYGKHRCRLHPEYTLCMYVCTACTAVYKGRSMSAAKGKHLAEQPHGLLVVSVVARATLHVISCGPTAVLVKLWCCTCSPFAGNCG